MTGLDLLLAVAGAAVTIMVVVGMILITPRGQVEARPEVDAEPAVPSTRPEPVERRFGPPAVASPQPQEAAVDGSARRA
ncbi:MAG: hypothetical protein AVDCRST_MAG38-408 [uncultured Solirubrobacteraceae bacterium]|uniref:Uncharacterized protein n=1 Tax=uncultured Solirubrobacteraceae bacterium TaxID=1162706 RepID=A0A6J4R712_9ACTN|nr:MAG: hypothetical protein AVDCRST_MAG38-408 [uncultured Solirubrobacteraceae bacterium]